MNNHRDIEKKQILYFSKKAKFHIENKLKKLIRHLALEKA